MTESDAPINDLRPLCVDLDGTLINSDVTVESLLTMVRRYPIQSLAIPFWFAGGRAGGKDQICQRVTLNAAALPYRQDVIDYIRQQKDAGRRVILATASHESIAHAVAEHLDLFDDVIASN